MIPNEIKKFYKDASDLSNYKIVEVENSGIESLKHALWMGGLVQNMNLK